MKFKDKKFELLKILYLKKFDGKYYDTVKILEQFGTTNYQEAKNISKSLSDEGYIKIISGKHSIEAIIEPSGIEFIEDLDERENRYEPSDNFEKQEKEVIKQKLDEFSVRLSKIEVGQQIIYDDFLEEIENLKRLLNILGKKDWTQILKGKLVDAGFGSLLETVGKLIIETFKDKNLLN